MDINLPPRFTGTATFKAEKQDSRFPKALADGQARQSD